MALQPIKWRNDDCRKDYDVNRRCPPYECETPVETHGDIISILWSGWPICPECGTDLSPMEE